MARGHQRLCGWNSCGKKSLNRDSPSHCSLWPHSSPPPSHNMDLFGSHCHLPVVNHSRPSPGMWCVLWLLIIRRSGYVPHNTRTVLLQQTKSPRKARVRYLGNSVRTSMLGHSFQHALCFLPLIALRFLNPRMSTLYLKLSADFSSKKLSPHHQEGSPCSV